MVHPSTISMPPEMHRFRWHRLGTGTFETARGVHFKATEGRQVSYKLCFGQKLFDIGALDLG